MIDAELVAARREVAAGTARSRIYVQRSRINYKAEPPSTSASNSAELGTAVSRIGITNAPSRGPKDALVTIVEFGDFECPFTKRAQVALDTLLENNPNDVRIVWRDMPLSMHKNSQTAATLARQAYLKRGDTMFWTAQMRIFAMQSSLSNAALLRLAPGLGLDSASTAAALIESPFIEKFKSDAAESTAGGGTGTPTFFFNGRYLGGSHAVAVYQTAVDQERANARRMLANGTPRANLYNALIARISVPNVKE
jgi:protein-disulfide isomerase